MEYKTRRQFLKTGGLGLVGTLFYPEITIAKRLNKEIIKKALEPNLKPLTKKIIEIESNWRYWEQGKDEDIGLMQITPITLKEWNQHGKGRRYNKYDLFEPIVNVTVGEWYLHERIKNHYLPHYKLKKTKENMAASYNAGPTHIGEEVGDVMENFNKLPKKTQRYLKKLWKLS